MYFVSIIIPLKTINAFVRESVGYIQQLDYSEYEVILFPDLDEEESFPLTRVVATDSVGPAEKRDLALKYAKGDILAFI